MSRSHRFAANFVMMIAAVAGFASDVPGQAPEPELALKGLDPIELIQHGAEKAGSETVSSIAGNYRYRFVSEENRMRFEANPERFGIRFGGACMRMGPLSGRGDSERFIVHDGGIYLFASDACRNTFLRTPDRFVVRPAAPLAASEDSRRLAGQALKRAVDASGGSRKIADVKSVLVETEISRNSGDDVVRIIRRTMFAPPCDFMTEDIADDYRGGWKLHGDRGLFTWGKGDWAAPSVSRFMKRTAQHEPLAILVAFASGKGEWAYDSTQSAVRSEMDVVIFRIDDSVTTLDIDRKSGLVRRAAFVGWGNLGMTPFERSYDDHRPVSGMLMPYSVKTLIDGKPTENVTYKIIAVRIDAPEDARLLNSVPDGLDVSK